MNRPVRIAYGSFFWSFYGGKNMEKIMLTAMLPGELHRQLKMLAAQRGVSMTQIVTEGTRRVLAEAEKTMVKK